MAVLSNGTLLSTINGYVRIEDYTGDPVLTENGFHPVKVEPCQTPDKLVRLYIWSLLEPIYISSYSYALGVEYEKCKDRGTVGPCLCKPFNRCWDQCPPNHPEKLHIIFPNNLNFFKLRKNGYLFAPRTGEYTYVHNNKNIVKEERDKGFQFGKTYKDILEDMPLFNVKEVLDNGPDKFMSFINGWQESVGGVILDMWNYRFVLRNKELAYQLQFLLNYFGTPTALTDYKSNVFGENCYLIEFCKNKKPFFHKTWVYNNRIYYQIKKWTPFDQYDEKISDLKWYKVIKVTDDSEYFCCPFLCKLD